MTIAEFRGRITDEQIERASLEELEVLSGELLRRSAAIKDSLEHAHSNRRMTGEYADPDWYRRATSAKRWVGRQMQIVNRRRGELRRADKESRRQETKEHTNSGRQSFDRAFVGAAKEILNNETFGRIVDRATTVVEQAQQD